MHRVRARGHALADDEDVGAVVDVVLHPKAERLPHRLVRAVAHHGVHKEDVILREERRRLGHDPRVVVHQRRESRRVEGSLAAVALPLEVGAGRDVLDAVVPARPHVRPPEVERLLHDRREVVAVVDYHIHRAWLQAKKPRVVRVLRGRVEDVDAWVLRKHGARVLDNAHVDVDAPDVRALEVVVPHLQALALRHTNLGDVAHLVSDGIEQGRVEVGVLVIIPGFVRAIVEGEVLER
mmetsp:Transcript_29699/g.81597  ORF Transcript_29699/g.81597 Transcript_29699/m.81597 type:complete len:237 (+) Transcript_29699:217-927(+)